MAKKENAFMKEFREFISKGNAMDLAIGVVIGTAFLQLLIPSLMTS